MKKIVLTGGGTAGHVTPNIALMPELKKNGYEIHYIGSYDIYLGINRPWYNPDSRILAAMGRGALDSK